MNQKAQVYDSLHYIPILKNVNFCDLLKKFQTQGKINRTFENSRGQKVSFQMWLLGLIENSNLGINFKRAKEILVLESIVAWLKFWRKKLI